MMSLRKKLAKGIVAALKKDLRTRHTLKNLFYEGDGGPIDKIDGEVQREIFKRWEAIAEVGLKKMEKSK